MDQHGTSHSQAVLQELLVSETTSKSALSPAVRNLLCDIGLTNSYDQQDSLISSGLGLESQEWTVVECEKRLSNDSSCETLCEQLPLKSDFSELHEYYKAAVRTLAPVFEMCDKMLYSLMREQFTLKYAENLSWTKNVQLVTDCFDLSTRGDAEVVLSLLLLSGILERSLGSVFLLKGSQCPALLKDLLMSKELCSILEPSIIELLQIVLGPPVSMNLRNVAWHGFFSDGELQRRYISFLLVLTARIGKQLSCKEISSEDLPTREFVSFPATDSMLEKFPEMKDSDFDEVECIIKNSWMVNNSNIGLFHLAFSCYREARYGWCAVQLFPLLEHALRRLFVLVNQCPNRLLTAQASTLFTTFEEILDQRVDGGSESKLVSVLGESCLDFLHDLLVYPAGPRARDKIGHGEADFSAVPQSLANALLYLSIYLSSKLSPHNNDFCEGFCSKVVESMGSYSSVFHPIPQLRQKVIKLCELGDNLHCSLNTVPALDKRNPNGGLEVYTTDNEVFCKTQTAMMYFSEELSKQTEKISDNDWEFVGMRLGNAFISVSADVKTLLDFKLHTLYRWQKDTNSGAAVSESEIVGLLSRVIAEAETCLLQTGETAKSRQEQLHSMQLRSRQRGNLKSLLLLLPTLSLYSNFVVTMVTWLFCRLDQYVSLNEDSRKLLRKFLKATLQSCENLRTQTSSQQNKWILAGETIHSLIQSSSQILKLKHFTEKSAVT